MSWTCDACGRAPADVDELLHWPIQTEGGILCPECDQEPEPERIPEEYSSAGPIEPGGLPQWGGFDDSLRLPQGF
jgi:hypothetical protein